MRLRFLESGITNGIISSSLEYRVESLFEDYKHKFAEKTQEVLTLAEQEAKELKYGIVGTESILLAILKHKNNIGAKLLEKFNVDYKNARNEAINIAGIGDITELRADLYSPPVLDLFDRANMYSKKMRDGYIKTEHLMLAILHDDQAFAPRLLENLGINRLNTSDRLFLLLGIPKIDP